MDQTEERRAREKEQRREYILDRAQELIFKQGFENITIEEIARQSGYTKRSIYLYFKDREEIFYSLVLRGQLLLLQRLKEAAGEANQTGRTLSSFAWGFFRFSHENPEFFELIMQYETRRHTYTLGHMEEASSRAECQNLSVEQGEILTQALEKDLKEGRIRSSLTARALMLLLWSQTFGVMQALLMRKEAFCQVYGADPESFFQIFIDGVERALQGNDGLSRPS